MPKIARMLSASGRVGHPVLVALILLGITGCRGLGRGHEARHIPQLGVIDPNQPRELHKVPQPPYVIEPPDELEISAKPPLSDAASSAYVVGADGFVDLGFAGDVFIAGSTLAEAEERIALHLAGLKQPQDGASGEPVRVSVRLANGQSKFYYVLGAVGNPGRFKSTGGETVLDAIVQAGLRSHSLPEKAYLARPHPHGGPDQVLKIDWIGIKDRGDTLTNYQVVPGDRIIVPGTRPPGLLGSLWGR
jgi:polysaccharide export outer membrane protein